MTEKYKVIGMFSGGLDSILAAKIMLNEGLEVIALHFYTGFNGKLSREIPKRPGWKWTTAESVVNSADSLGIKLVSKNVSNEYIDIIIHQEYSYGSGVNPCIDCRIFLLKKTRELLETEQAILAKKGNEMREFTVKPTDHKYIEPLLIH